MADDLTQPAPAIIQPQRRGSSGWDPRDVAAGIANLRDQNAAAAVDKVGDAEATTEGTTSLANAPDFYQHPIVPVLQRLASGSSNGMVDPRHAAIVRAIFGK